MYVFKFFLFRSIKCFNTAGYFVILLNSIFVNFCPCFFFLVIYLCTFHSGFNLFCYLLFMHTPRSFMYFFICLCYLFSSCFSFSQFDFSYSTLNFRIYLSWKSSTHHSQLLSSSLLLFLAINLFIIFR